MHRTALALCLAALFATPAPAAQSPAPPPPPPPPPARKAAPPPEPEPERRKVPDPNAPWGQLPDDLLHVLEAKSAGYARRALKFSCRETVRVAQYDGGEAKSESVREYDYLLITDTEAPEGYRAVRTRPGSSDAKPENVTLPFPEPYLWGALFDPRIRSTLRFQVGEWHTTPWKLAIPVAWVSSAPVFDKERVTEWSGTAEIEYRTGNLVRIVARPSLQDEKLSAELQRFLTSLKFMGMSTGSPPVGLELTVDFDDEHDGFTYPSRVELVTFQQVGPEQRQTLSRRILHYSEYRFFGAKVEDRIPPLTWRPPGQ